MYVPPATLIDNAAIVVVGKVSKIDPTAPPDTEFAIIDVREVLKGDPNIKSVKLMQPALKARLSHRVTVSAGEQGVFILNKIPEPDAYRFGHPSQVVVFNEQTEKEVVASYRKLVEERLKLPTGKPVNGLAARAEVIRERGRIGVRFSIKNVSDKPITICTWIGGQPLQVQWTGPDGKAIESKHYDWMKSARIRGVVKEDFVTIAPGGIVFMGPHGSAMEDFVFNLPDGESKIVVSYSNKNDGANFKIEGVWTGAAASNEVVVKK